MAQPAHVEPRYTAQSYFALVDSGVLRHDDRVELLEGVIVTMSPQSPRHASATTRVAEAIRDAIGKRAVIRVQSPLIAGPRSVPEPDIAVVTGPASAYDDAHPDAALLVVEIADSSLPQDRLTKAAVYAAAGIPEYWLVNLRDDQVEVLRSPDPAAGNFRDCRTARRGERIGIAAFTGASVLVDDLLPGK